MCTAAAEGTLLGSPLGFPRRPWVRVPLNSDFPIQTFLEGFGANLGVNPDSATY